MTRTVEVRRNTPLLLTVGGLATLTAAAYVLRAAADGSVVEWIVAAGSALLAAGYLGAALDSRAPLLVADEHGVRARVGRSWLGFPWPSVERVTYRPRAGLHDGRLVIEPDSEPFLEDPRGRLLLRLNSWWYGAPLALPIGLATRAVCEEDLESALERLAGSRLSVEAATPAGPAIQADVPDDTDEEPDPGRWRDPRPALAAGIVRLSDRWRSSRFDSTPGEGESAPAAEPAAAAPAVPSPLRRLRPALRTQVRLDHVVGAHALAPQPDEATATLPELEELRRQEPEEIVDFTEPSPVADPVIGPELAAARARLRLSIDELAARTRIRPHVIEAIEVDDFDSCGGDFYARGHLRTLARVLGVDAGPLIATYDEEYAHAPVSPRRIFEAELGSGATGALHTTRGGPNWSVLVAAVMAVVLAWSVARLVVDGPVATSQPSLGAGSGGVGSPVTASGDKVSLVLRAAGGGAHVVVRDGKDRIVLQDDLAYGASRTVEAVPPVRVDSSDGSLVVTVDGKDRGPLGETGQGATGTFVTSR